MRELTFRAKSTKEAIGRMVEELGPHAEIIARRQVEDREGAIWFEVTAAPGDGSEAEGPVGGAKRRAVGLAAAAALTVLLVAAYLLFPLQGGAPVGASEPLALAVLPFANLSADPDQEYFCDGIAEELRNRLARLEGLKVIARTSSEMFKGEKVGIAEIGETLRVGRIIEGSVRHSGETMRITVQLIDVSDGSHIWSNSYDMQAADSLRVEDEIALAVAAALEVNLDLPERRVLTKRYTENEEAHKYLMQGHFYHAKVTMTDRAIESYRKAVEADPDFALGWAYLGKTILCYTMTDPVIFPYTEERGAEAEACIERSLELDPNLSAGHLGRGILLFMRDFDRPNSIKAIRRALQLDPSYGHAWLFLASVYLQEGRIDEAKRILADLLECDPFDRYNGWHMALADYLAGDIDSVADRLHAMARQHPDYAWIALYVLHSFFIGANRYDAAAEAIEDSFASSVEWVPMVPAIREARLAGGLPAVLKVFKNHGVALGYDGHLSLGENNEAITVLERMVQNRAYLILFINVDPVFEPLRDHPRFKALLRKMNYTT